MFNYNIQYSQLRNSILVTASLIAIIKFPLSASTSQKISNNITFVNPSTTKFNQLLIHYSHAYAFNYPCFNYNGILALTFIHVCTLSTTKIPPSLILIMQAFQNIFF